MPHNPQRRTAIIAWVVTGLLVFAIFAPSIFGMDGMNGGFAISFLSLIAAITSFVVAIMFQGRAKALDGILDGEKRLAYWKYDPSEWRDYSEKEFAREKKDKLSLFYLVAAMCLVVGGIFSLTHPDGGWVVMGVLAALLVLILIVIFITTRYDYWMNKKYLGEAYITPDGVYLNRKLHLFQGWGARLEETFYDEEGKFLAFKYSTPNRSGRSDYTVRVPVPSGKEAEARDVLAAFKQEKPALSE